MEETTEETPDTAPQTKEESDRILADPVEQQKAQQNNDQLIKQLQEELKKLREGK